MRSLASHDEGGACPATCTSSDGQSYTCGTSVSLFLRTHAFPPTSSSPIYRSMGQRGLFVRPRRVAGWVRLYWVHLPVRRLPRHMFWLQLRLLENK